MFKYRTHYGGVSKEWAPYWMPAATSVYILILRAIQKYPGRTRQEYVDETRYLVNVPGKKARTILYSISGSRLGAVIKAGFVETFQGIGDPPARSKRARITKKGIEYLKWIDAKNKPPRIKSGKLEFMLHVSYLNKQFKHWFDKEDKDAETSNA